VALGCNSSARLKAKGAPLLSGGANKVVEIDETYVGGKEGNKHAWKRTPGRQGGAGKAPVLSLVERDGDVRSHHVGERQWRDAWPDHYQANRQGQLHHDGRKPRLSADH
jgi:hypothetical protein